MNKCARQHQAQPHIPNSFPPGAEAGTGTSPPRICLHPWTVPLTPVVPRVLSPLLSPVRGPVATPKGCERRTSSSLLRAGPEEGVQTSFLRIHLASLNLSLLLSHVGATVTAQGSHDVTRK